MFKKKAQRRISEGELICVANNSPDEWRNNKLSNAKLQFLLEALENTTNSVFNEDGFMSFQMRI